MQTPSSKTPSEVAQAIPGDIYAEALIREGLHPGPELVERLQRLHLSGLTSGLVMRAYHAHHQAELRKRQDSNQSATGIPSRS
jgi:hypothetical protein